MNGVVIAPNWLGDAVMSLPALAALRAATPDHDWTVMARSAVAPVFELAQLGFTVARLPPPPSLRVPRRGAETVVVFPNSFYSGLLAWRIGGRQRIGYARDRRGWLLRPAVAPPAPGSIPAHESFYYLELLRRAGLIARLPAAAEIAAQRVALHPAAVEIESWRARLGPSPKVAMHVGATFGTAKRWMPERFAELARTLIARGAHVVLIGSAAERGLAETVRQQAGGGPGMDNTAGQTTLPQLVALLAACDLLVANDSGPMHLAGAVGTAVVALFGSTNERETYPLAAAGKLRLVKTPDIACSPCKRRECPIDHRCMTRMSVATVLAAVEESLCLPPRG